jgi:hypothetical protein
MKKILVSLGFAFALVSTAVAGDFTHAVTSPGSYSVQVSVPNAGTAFQYAGANGGYGSNYVINNGPLGNYLLHEWQSVTIQGAIAAGNYNVYQYVGWGGGFSVTHIGW